VRADTERIKLLSTKEAFVQCQEILLGLTVLIQRMCIPYHSDMCTGRGIQ